MAVGRTDGTALQHMHQHVRSGSDHYDLLILGSGSTAFAAAIRAKELGKAEALKIAAISFTKDVSKLSCCAS